ncbi:hypothetical protein Btru_015163 [Bulinus truncatus]|nr:hypothetical protein Btru_015163 [Bulinus truncatus]
MSDEDSQSRMEEVDEKEESEHLNSESDACQEDKTTSTIENELDNTAEDMMTDMKLEDTIDELHELRSPKPDFNWIYHIEIYPWNADDMTENFVRLIKLSQFSQVCMRKKDMGKETSDTEKVNDKLSGRLRIGCLHLYTDTSQNAKNIMRSATWKTMSAKELTFEITKQGSNPEQIETATLKLDTYMATKSRFRDKPKGELKDRSAKVSNIPGTISRDFLDVVFSRAYPVVEGTTIREYLKEKEGKSQQRLLEIKDFNGSLDFDCLCRGSCRAFVLAHRNVSINGQKLAIVANDKETMVVPPFTHELSSKQQNTAETGVNAVKPQSANMLPRGVKCVNIPGFTREPAAINYRGRGLGRVAVVPQRPATATLIRSGAGMPVPMTGRQKMNEKMKRNNFGMAAGGAALSGVAGFIGNRGPLINSVGDSFKQELESLQNQLERSTQALEAKIAMLQQSTQVAAYYQGDVLEEGDWDEDDYNYGAGYGQADYFLDETQYGTNDTHGFHFNVHHSGRPKSGSFLNAASNVGQIAAQKLHHGVQQGFPNTGQILHPGSAALMRGDNRRVGRRGRGQMRGGASNYW